MQNQTEIITIDGPAGVGKTTLAARLAEKMRLPSLDTGAMFRYMALCLGEAGKNMSKADLEKHKFIFSLSGSGKDTHLLCNGHIIGQEIRTEKIGALASSLAGRAEVRAILLTAQRELGSRYSLVVEGRDMGTVVFPNASFKFFLDAAPAERARRRWLELQHKGQNISLEDLEEQIRKRDYQDRSRPIAPLKPASDALIVDTSTRNIDQVLAVLENHILENGGKIPS